MTTENPKKTAGLPSGALGPIDPTQESRTSAPVNPAAVEESKFYANSSQKHRQELGYIGQLLGGKENAKYNVAGTVVIVAFIFLLATCTVSEEKFPYLKVLRPALLSLITLIFGYFFGAKKDK
ncbi:hypothetical protein [Robbsia andropogonis]|uniref:hypothetical protein n=1 Tax=Robbsia andropogonis TaxID=28092 RepID=UPI00209F1264|nr:hypothetical protein [Robbsia andropogonis]MCP1120511.1 hypothetical protein [Robbsia andropogonis]MCP1131292.1 hypothetical protein [Robbsia andropogonis]